MVMRNWSRLAGRALMWGIILGMAAKVGCSLFMTALTHAYLTSRGWTAAQIHAFFGQQFQSWILLLIGLIPEAVGGLAGGYMAASMAPRLEYWHGLVALLLMELITYGPVLTRVPVVFTVLAVSVALLLAFVGAGWAKARKLRATPDVTG